MIYDENLNKLKLEKGNLINTIYQEQQTIKTSYKPPSACTANSAISFREVSFK